MPFRKRDRDLGLEDRKEGDPSNDMFPEGPSDKIDLLQQHHQPSAKRPRSGGFELSSSVDTIVDKMLGESSSGTEPEAGEGNVVTRQPTDASSTSGSAAVAAAEEEVLHPNQNSNENQESHGSVFVLSAEAAGEEVAVSGDGVGQAEQVLNPNHNEMQDFPPSCEGPVEEADGAAQDVSKAPGPAKEVINMNQTRNQEELYDLFEDPSPEKTGDGQFAPLASDAAEEILNLSTNESQDNRSLSEGSVEVDAAQAAKEKSEEFGDEGIEERGFGKGEQAVPNVPRVPRKVLNPNQDLNPVEVSLSSEKSRGEEAGHAEIPDEFLALNLSREESQQRPTEHVSSAESGQKSRELELAKTVASKNVAQAGGWVSRFGVSSLWGGWQIKSNVLHGRCSAVSATIVKTDLGSGTRAGPQDGYFNLIDRDGLMHILGFLSTPDLARFRGSFTGARDVVSSHAALEIMERFPMIRVGVREPALSDMSQRRLTFGNCTADPAAGFSSPDKQYPFGVVGVLDRPKHASHHLQHAVRQQQAMVSQGISDGSVRRSSSASMGVHGSRFSRRLAANARGGFVGVGVVGNRGGGGGSSMAGLERCNKGIGLVKCEGRTLESAFPSLHYLEEFGDLLMSQQKTLPSLDIFETQRRNLGFAPNEFVTPRIRAEHVDRMVEVALRFKLSTVALHAAVCALDVCLGKIAVPGNRLKMLASVCIMIQSQESEETRSMTTSDVIVICARQFNPSQVHSTYNIVVSNTQEATSRTVPATAAEILNRLLVGIGEVSGLTRPLGRSWDKKGVPVQEENILAILFIDLAMLDDYMFRFRPSTLAAAALFFASVTAVYYSKEECRLIMEVLGRQYRPFIPLNPDLERRPFRDPSLSHFMSSQPCEAGAVRMCTERLWLLHKDFVNQISNNNPSPSPTLEGIKNKFSASGPIRLQAYRNLGLVPKPLLESMLDKHLPSTVTPHDLVGFHGVVGGASASTSSAATTGARSGGSSSKY